jgi:hypothetical protein
MSPRTTQPPKVLWEGLQDMNFVHCLHIVLIIMKFRNVFEFFFLLGWEVWGKEVTWEDLSMEEFSIGKENLHLDILVLFKKQSEIK